MASSPLDVLHHLHMVSSPSEKCWHSPAYTLEISCVGRRPPDSRCCLLTASVEATWGTGLELQAFWLFPAACVADSEAFGQGLLERGSLLPYSGTVALTGALGGELAGTPGRSASNASLKSLSFLLVCDGNNSIQVPWMFPCAPLPSVSISLILFLHVDIFLQATVVAAQTT